MFIYRWLTQWRWCPWPTPIPSYPAEQSWRQETLQLKGGAHGKSWCSTPQIFIVSFKSKWVYIYIYISWYIMVYHGILYKKSTNGPSSCKLIDISLTISMSLSGSQQLDGWFRTKFLKNRQLGDKSLVTNKWSNCQICGYYILWWTNIAMENGHL